MGEGITKVLNDQQTRKFYRPLEYMMPKELDTFMKETYLGVSFKMKTGKRTNIEVGFTTEGLSHLVSDTKQQLKKDGTIQKPALVRKDLEDLKSILKGSKYIPPPEGPGFGKHKEVKLIYYFATKLHNETVIFTIREFKQPVNGVSFDVYSAKVASRKSSTQ